MKRAVLEIHSWVGSTVTTALHWYGVIKFQDGDKVLDHYMEYKLTASQARRLNKDAKDFSAVPYKRKAGETSQQYYSEQEIVEQAKKEYKTHFPTADYLIKTYFSCCDPRPVLDGPEEFMRCANDINARAEAIDYWDGGKDKEMGVLHNEWSSLLKEFGDER